METELPVIPELPKAPAARIGRPPAGSSPVDEYTVEQLVTLLEEADGDLNLFFSEKRFVHTHAGSRIRHLSRIYMRLSQPENKVHLAKWEQLIRCYKQARTMNAERKALDFLEKIREPDPSSDSIKSQLDYASFWLKDWQEGQKQQGRKPQAVNSGDADMLAAVQQMLEKMNNKPTLSKEAQIAADMEGE